MTVLRYLVTSFIETQVQYNDICKVTCILVQTLNYPHKTTDIVRILYLPSIGKILLWNNFRNLRTYLFLRLLVNVSIIQSGKDSSTF